MVGHFIRGAEPSNVAPFKPRRAVAPAPDDWLAHTCDAIVQRTEEHYGPPDRPAAVGAARDRSR